MLGCPKGRVSVYSESRLDTRRTSDRLRDTCCKTASARRSVFFGSCGQFSSIIVSVLGGTGHQPIGVPSVRGKRHWKGRRHIGGCPATHRDKHSSHHVLTCR